MPELYIITGSNGAGKSTVGPNYLPQHIRQHNTVFDGDKLCAKAKRIMAKRVESAQRSPKNWPLNLLKLHLIL